MNLKTAIKNRIPGGLLFYDFFHFRKLKTAPTNPLNAAIVTVHNNKVASMRKRFFLGKSKSFTSWWFKSYNEFLYSIMCDLFTDVDKGESEVLNINGIKFQVLKSYRERCIFASEAIDCLFSDLIDRNLYDVVTYEGPYEFNAVKITPGNVVIDVGANMGLFSAFAANKGATVYAFEPNEDVVDRHLSKTVELNKNIIICKSALSDCNEEAEFVISKSNIGASHLKSTLRTGKGCLQANEQVSIVQTISLDEFVSDNKLERVDFIKADIEGAERYMLMGAKQVLKEFAPKLAICTYHLPDDRKVLREIILEANPNYVIEEKYKKMYAYVPNR